MPRKKAEMPSQSEQHDHKLQCDLYLAMNWLNEFYQDAEEEMLHKKTESCATSINKIMDHLPEVIKCYFAAIHGGRHV